MFVLLHSEEVPDDGSGLTGVVAGSLRAAAGAGRGRKLSSLEAVWNESSVW